MRRLGLALATTSDLLAAVLEPWVAERRFLVGGDSNTSPLFDSDYPNTKWESKVEYRVFRTPQSGRLVRRDATAPRRQIRTYFDPRAGPREIDRVFIDPETYNRLVGCHVLDDLAVAELSDHAPLVVDIAV